MKKLFSLSLLFGLFISSYALAYLPGTVTSVSDKQRIERAQVTTSCGTGSCTVASSTSGVSGVANAGSGAYTVSFVAGTFSAAPTCVALCGGATSNPCTAAPGASSTSGFVFTAFQADHSTQTSNNIQVICVGTR